MKADRSVRGGGVWDGGEGEVKGEWIEVWGGSVRVRWRLMEGYGRRNRDITFSSFMAVPSSPPISPFPRYKNNQRASRIKCTS